jgi:hypothetical protein
MTVAQEAVANAALEVQAAASAPQIILDPFEGERIDVTGWDDGEVLDALAQWDNLHKRYAEKFREAEASCKRILEARIRARGAKGIPHPDYECELEPEYGPVLTDLIALREAAKLLKPDEAAKVIRHVPAFQPPAIPEHDEPGAAVSIAALKKRYAGSRVAAVLERGYSKPLIGSRFVFRRVKSAPKPVEAIEGAA